MASEGAGLALTPVWREVARIGLRTLCFYVLVLAILLMWHSGGLFIYESF